MTGERRSYLKMIKKRDKLYLIEIGVLITLLIIMVVVFL
jgi:hypothetical protein